MFATYRCRFEVDFFLVDEITLVAYEQLVHIFVGVAVNFVQPRFNIREAVFVGHVVDDDDTVCPAVVGTRNCSEPFLACSIPLYK